MATPESLGVLLIVTGSRGYPGGKDRVESALTAWLDQHPKAGHELYVGDCANSPDEWAQDWWKRCGLKGRMFRAHWVKDGEQDWAAGLKRNARMVNAARDDDHYRPVFCLAFWDGKSKGTLDTITRCVRSGINVDIVPPQVGL